MNQQPSEQTVVPPAGMNRRGVLHSLAVGVWCVALFAACLCFYTRNNGFPLEFHPDEPGKVRQVMEGTRNYLHPQLMLEATELWRKINPTTDDPLAIVIAGRQVSAFFGAGAVTMLALTAYLCAGWWGLVIGSVMLGLCPPILIYSHYMKEDASLLFGVAMVILASRVVWMTRRWWARILAWVMLAAGCALAASWKYVGAMAVLMPLALIFLAPGFKWYRPILRLLLLVLLFVLFLGVINHRVLNPGGLDFARVVTNPQDWRVLLNPVFLRGVETEIAHSSTQHWFLTANQPNTYMIRTAISQSWPVAVIPILFLPLALWLTRKQGFFWEMVLVGFMVCCTLVLSYSVILFPRYALPVTAMVYLLATIVIGRLLLSGESRPILQVTLGTLILVIVLCLGFPACIDYTHQFGNDSRFALRDWIKVNLPRNARVLADGYAELTAREIGRGDLNINSHFILPLMPGFEYQLRRGGEKYIVICDLAYNRYFETSALPAPGHEQTCENARKFYAKLLKEHVPVWSYKSARPMYAFTNPAISVYRLKSGEKP